MSRWLEHAAQKLAQRAGVTGMPRPALRLIVVMAVIAVLVAAGWPLLAGEPVPAWRFGQVIGLLVLAQLLSLRMQMGALTINVSWGEAAVIIGFTLIQPQWMPLAMLLGVLGVKTVRTLVNNEHNFIENVRATSSLTLCVSVAALVVMAIVTPDREGLVPSTDLVPLAIAAIVYLLGTAALLAVHLGLRDGESMVGVVWTALRGTPVMIVGNLTLGLIAAWNFKGDKSYLLIVIVPLLWLLRQLYLHRLREDEERRMWHSFALASRSLHRLDEVAVAQEGARAARALFPIRSVEVTVFGSQTRYVLATGMSTVESFRVDPEESTVDSPDAVRRKLEVAGAPVGLLVLRPQRFGAWRDNDQHRLAAFGDALAAALHDAATHSALRDLKARNSYESSHDSLTELYNRDALLDHGDALLQSLPATHPVALLLLDVDHFKEVNDTLGHLVGDDLLQQLGGRLKEDAGASELVARLGGDGFALLLTDLPDDPGASTLAAATTVALRRARGLANLLAEPVDAAGVKLSRDVSVGVVVAQAGVHDLTELLRRGDIALYQAKDSGSRVTAYEAVRDETSIDRLALVAELRTALSTEDQLAIVLQPAVDLATGLPSSVEALVRWQHPRRGPLTPVHFVRAVEASDLLGQFTRYVLDHALSACARWAREGYELPIAVNLSPRSLLDPQLPVDVAELLRRHGVPPQRLILEITETVMLSPLKITDHVLQGLRSLGVRLSVDDFGTGCSSLTFLTRVNVDELKIDRTFVGRMAESREAAAIVRAVIDLGSQLSIRVVAEGVETSEQRATLARLGCESGQGFHFSRPVPVDELVEVVQALKAKVRVVRPIRSAEAG